jgi:TPR repeat protein
MNIFSQPAVSPARYGILMALLMALSSSVSSGVPSGAVRPVVRGGAQILAKLGIGGLRRQLNRIYKRDEWKDVFEGLVDLYLDTLDKDKVPPELQRLSGTAIAANKGDPIAQRTLGLAYQNGNKVKRDFKKAGYWFSKAVEEADGPSMIFLGRLFNRGLGVPKNTVGAYCLFHLAASHGESALAQREIKATRRRMNSSQLAESQTCMK